MLAPWFRNLGCWQTSPSILPYARGSSTWLADGCSMAQSQHIRIQHPLAQTYPITSKTQQSISETPRRQLPMNLRSTVLGQSIGELDRSATDKPHIRHETTWQTSKVYSCTLAFLCANLLINAATASFALSHRQFYNTLYHNTGAGSDVPRFFRSDFITNILNPKHKNVSVLVHSSSSGIAGIVQE